MNRITLPCTPLWENGKDVHLESYKHFISLGWKFKGHTKYTHEDGRNSYFWILETDEKDLPAIRERITGKKQEQVMEPPKPVPNISYDDFTKVELRIATITDAKPHPDAKVDKLLILTVDLGDQTRQIVAGIKKHYDADALKGKQIVVVCNLEPRTLRGETSHGMLLAASDEEGNVVLLTPDKPIKAGSVVK